jgi:hypothetical protein
MELDDEEKALLLEVLNNYHKQQRELLQSMVGTLYPPMVRNRLVVARNLLAKLGVYI